MATGEQLDERFWETWNFKEGGSAHYAEITTNPYVLKIMLVARGNQTELGYWKDVALGLAELVDTLTRQHFRPR